MIKTTRFTAFVLLISAAAVWLFIGEFTGNYDDGDQLHFFVKKPPTLQFFFKNPYANDFMDEERDYSKKFDPSVRFLITTAEFGEFLNYCEYRYGVAGDDKIATRNACMKVIETSSGKN